MITIRYLNNVLRCKEWKVCSFPSFLHISFASKYIFRRHMEKNMIGYLPSINTFRNIFDASIEQELRNRLQTMKQECRKLENDQRTEAKKRMNELKPIVYLFEEIENTENDLKELKSMGKEFIEIEDEILKSSIIEECEIYKKKIDKLKSEVLDLLVPIDYIDNKDILLEISAGVGGKEAMLFANDLFLMYCKFAEWKDWKFEILKHEDMELDGIRQGSISISGKNVGKYLKFEGGVHRVQRIPKTERHGRIHTSVATVTILPQPSAIDVKIESKDLLVETKRSKGAGGQHVNTTDSCVRITHIPSGITVERQTERDQHLNRQSALQSLRTILYQKQVQKMESEQKSNRKLQIGTGARSEKVRTYNFVQDRITDHRINENIYGIESFFEGRQQLEKLIIMLLEASKTEKLLEILS